MSAAPASISAIVPVHNGACFVSEALRSVKGQTLAADEIIVVDDGSSDGSADIVRREHPDVVLIAQPRGGPAAARNAGARRARCDALAFLDHDDLWPPERNSALLQAWRAHPEADVVCGSFSLLLGPGASDDPRLRRAEGGHVPFLFSALMIRRSCWLAHGGMESVRDYAEDLDLHLRLSEAGASHPLHRRRYPDLPHPWGQPVARGLPQLSRPALGLARGRSAPSRMTREP